MAFVAVRYLSSLGGAGSIDSKPLALLWEPGCSLLWDSMFLIEESGLLGDFEDVLPTSFANFNFDFEALPDMRVALLRIERFKGSGERLTGEVLPLKRVPVIAAGGKIAFMN
jgi:hypothetical protein